jgi:glycosyltransferase involved in cell wall biosynthesis
MNSFAIVLPCFNEEQELENVTTRLLANQDVDLVVIVNNNSRDKTEEIAKRLVSRSDRVKLLFEEKQGKGAAFCRGLSIVGEYDYVGVIDADSTYQSEHFSEMLAVAKNGNYDMIVGSRMQDYAENNARFGHIYGNKLISVLLKTLSGVELKDSMSGMRVMSRNFINSFESIAQGFQLEAEFSLTCGRNGMRYREVPVKYTERDAGNPSKLNTFRDGFKIMLFALQFAGFTLTSQIALIFSLILGLTAVFWGYSLFQEFLEYGKVNGIAAAVAVSILASTSIQIFLGAIIENRVRRLERHLMKR